MNERIPLEVPALTLGAHREASMVGTPAFVFSGLLIPFHLLPRLETKHGATNARGRTLAAFLAEAAGIAS
ncbi:MAG: hypothetical protein ACREF0_11055, partial [Acetobacteraceae bacterium]